MLEKYHQGLLYILFHCVSLAISLNPVAETSYTSGYSVVLTWLYVPSIGMYYFADIYNYPIVKRYLPILLQSINAGLIIIGMFSG